MAIFGSTASSATVPPTPFEMETFLRSWLSPIVNLISSGLTWFYHAGQFMYTQPPENSWKAMKENSGTAWGNVVANGYTAGAAFLGILSFGYLYKKGYLKSPFKNGIGYVSVDVNLPFVGFNGHLGTGYKNQYELSKLLSRGMKDVHNHIDDIESAFTDERSFHLSALNNLGKQVKGNDYSRICESNTSSTTSSTFRTRKYKPNNATSYDE